ncbi:hypothetical protein OH76DRAFT_1394630, partial [Lentinus brumalis]
MAPSFDKLNDTNYAEWRRFMQALLTKQGVWGVVSGTVTRPPGADTSNAMKAWNAHRSRGFSTRLSLRRDFFTMSKRDDQTMTSWIADVRRLAFKLKDIGATVTDEDMIIVLTKGLPASYEQLVVTLDATPSDELTVDNVVRRLVNEESRQ